MPRSFASTVSRALRVAWASPCSAIGLLLGAAVLLLGGSVRRVAGTLEFALPGHGRVGRLAGRLPFAAITFGHVIVGVSGVHQYETLGPLFLLAYPLASLAAAARGLPLHRGNRFEVEACALSAASDAVPPAPAAPDPGPSAPRSTARECRERAGRLRPPSPARQR